MDEPKQVTFNENDYTSSIARLICKNDLGICLWVNRVRALIKDERFYRSAKENHTRIPKDKELCRKPKDKTQESHRLAYTTHKIKERKRGGNQLIAILISSIIFKERSQYFRVIQDSTNPSPSPKMCT